VADGQQAVELFRTWQPDAILMDMRMPVMDGYEGTRLIRTLTGGEGIPILALTAADLDGEKAQIEAAGCSGLLNKPVTGAALAEALTTHLALSFGDTEPAELPSKPR